MALVHSFRFTLAKNSLQEPDRLFTKQGLRMALHTAFAVIHLIWGE